MAKSYTQTQLREVRNRLFDYASKTYEDKRKKAVAEFVANKPAVVVEYEKKHTALKKRRNKIDRDMQELRDSASSAVQRWKDQLDNVTHGYAPDARVRSEYYPGLGAEPRRLRDYGDRDFRTNVDAVEDIMFELTMQGTEFSLQDALAQLKKELS